jgi:hypothetical protein
VGESVSTTDRESGAPHLRFTRSTDVAGTLLLVCALAGGAVAEAQPAADHQRAPTWTAGSGTTLTLFPSGDLYRVYIADPHRPTNAIIEMIYQDSTIASASSPRVGLAAGGRFGILRIAPAAGSARSWQVSLIGGLDAFFDSQRRLDAVGWDGNYGITVTTSTPGRLALKVAVLPVGSGLDRRTSDSRRVLQETERWFSLAFYIDL